MYLERAIRASGPTADVTLHYTLGRLYIRNDEPTKAIDSLARVLSQNPDFFQGRLVMAQAYAANKDLKSAICHAAGDSRVRAARGLGARAVSGGGWPADRRRRQLHHCTGRAAAQPRAEDPADRRAARSEGVRARGGFAGEARKQHPDDPRFVRLQARALFDGGDRSGAILLLEQVAKASPQDTRHPFALADVYADAGRGGDAERVLRQIVAAEPTNAGALNYLGYLLAVRGEQLDEAIQLVQRALKEEPDNGAYLDSLGWAYFRRGNLDEAEKYLVAAVKQMPDNSEIQEHLGDLLCAEGTHVRGRLGMDACARWRRTGRRPGSDREEDQQCKRQSAKRKMTMRNEVAC